MHAPVSSPWPRWPQARSPAQSALLAQERFSFSSNRVAIYNIAGEVRVESGTGSNVIVEMTRGGDDSGRLNIDRRNQAGWDLFVVRYPESSVVYRKLGRFSRSEFSVADNGLFGLGNLEPGQGTDRVTAKAGADHDGNRIRVRGSGNGLEAHANLRVIVPAGKAVALHLGVGEVFVSGVASDLQIDTRSGSASAERTQGFLRIDTGSGSVRLSQASGDIAVNTGSGGVKGISLGNGVLKVHTGSGSIELSSVNATEASFTTGSGSVQTIDVRAPVLSINTGSGGIHARGVKSSKFDLHTGSGSVQLDLDSDIQLGRIRTGSGGVTITAPRELGAEITLDTGSGGIDVDIPLNVFERRRSFLRGRVGDGNGTLDVGTGSGGITLR